MSIEKILGIETEYGIVVRGTDDANPISASSTLINAYMSALAGTTVGPSPKVGWDFEDETPANDAREEIVRLSVAPDVETHLVNTVLTNGARYYVDHAHPEYSAPECSDALQALTYDVAGEEVLRRSMDAARRTLPEGQQIVVYKNNSDGKGNSYGCHENYLVARALPFRDIVAHLTAHIVTRQIFTGSGKVGSESPGSRTDEVPFQITQRADFFEEEVGLETTLKRPIINTRDEPHADAQLYRRLHVIAGDANMSQTATFLKLGTTAAVLAMLEDAAGGEPIGLTDPVAAMHAVSRDLSLADELAMRSGTAMSALEIQWELFGRVSDWADREGLDAIGGDDVGARIISEWRDALEGLSNDPMILADRLDWVAKYRLCDAYRQRHGLEWNDARLRAMDLQYHDLRDGHGLADHLGLRELIEHSAVEHAVEEPPASTRAYFRGKCLEKFPAEVVAANWDSLVFDVGASSLQRVPMMEPSKGSQAHVGELLASAHSAEELLEALGAGPPAPNT
ncbi:MAG: depupylase/deamidase Dop [Microthrixaceae bacterium]